MWLAQITFKLAEKPVHTDLPVLLHPLPFTDPYLAAVLPRVGVVGMVARLPPTGVSLCQRISWLFFEEGSCEMRPFWACSDLAVPNAPSRTCTLRLRAAPCPGDVMQPASCHSKTAQGGLITESARNILQVSGKAQFTGLGSQAHWIC